MATTGRDMNNYPPTWTSRPKRRNWKGWLLALAAIALLGSMCALSFNAESAASSKLPPPPGPYYVRLWCRNAAQQPPCV
jgi:hypothetical protein